MGGSQTDCGRLVRFTENGRVFAFGSNSWGQLGLGHKNTATMPSCIKSLKPEKATHVACGKSHTIVSTFSGKVFAFGSNMDCQLGLGDTEERSSPIEVAGVSAGEDGVRMLAAGCQHSAVLTVDGRVFMWGSNSDGQLGLGETDSVVNTPKLMDIRHRISHISCGYYHTALITDDGKLLMCGEGENGKLGLSRENRNVFVPTAVNVNAPIRSVACGGNHTIAVTMDGEVYGFGSNLSGQLGLGREILSFSVPECIETLLGKHICAVACGEIHTAFLTVEGQMYACGDARHGKLCIEIESGDDAIVHCTPQLVSRFLQYQVKQVACGGCHTMVRAIMDTNTTNGEPDIPVNGDVPLMLQKVDTSQMSSPAMETHSRMLPPLQNVPTINGFSEKPSSDDNHERKSEQGTIKEEDDEEADGDNRKKVQACVSPERQNGPEPFNQSIPESPQQKEDGENGGQMKNAEGNEGISDKKEDLFSKFNLRDASDLESEIPNESEEREEKVDEADTPRTLDAEENGISEKQDGADRRCSVDVTPTLTVTGTDGVDLNSDEASRFGGGDLTNLQTTMASLGKVEGRMAKFFNAFRRKKLSEENLSANAAWTDVDTSVSSENMKNGKRPSQDQLRADHIHKSKACVIL